jgi:hypothetical protein
MGVEPSLKQPWPWSIRLPVVAVLCVLVFGVYGLGPSPVMAVMCDAPAQVSGMVGTGLTDLAHCQVRQGRRFGWLPARTLEFNLIDVAITSRLCDNTPRGGVRFCHRLTLIGNQDEVTLPEIRTPLAADTLTDSLRGFMVGQGSDHLTWTAPDRLIHQLSTVVLALLLTITAWGFWAVQWPPRQPSPLAMDGEPEAKP